MLPPPKGAAKWKTFLIFKHFLLSQSGMVGNALFCFMFEHVLNTFLLGISTLNPANGTTLPLKLETLAHTFILDAEQCAMVVGNISKSLATWEELEENIIKKEKNIFYFEFG